MATYNKTAKRANRTINTQGHAAHAYDKKTELVTRVATCLVNEPKAYGDTTDEIVALAHEVAEADPGFVARLAVYARRELMMRTVSHLLVCVLAESDAVRGTGYLRAAARGVVRRGDDVTGVLACWKTRHPESMTPPDGIRKGLRDAMESFGAEDATRYLGRTDSFKMRDALRVLHPSVTDPKLREAFDAVVKQTARRPETWETELVSRGNTAETWNDLVARGRVPAMALARNLRNVIDAGTNLAPVIAALEDEATIRRSGMLPFRLYTAWREAAGASIDGWGWGTHFKLREARPLPTSLTRALNHAMLACAGNLPDLPGRTAVIIDGSGSMTGSLSERSSVSVLEAAAAIAAGIVARTDDAVVAVFGNDASLVTIASPDSPIATACSIICACDGGVTNMSSAVELLIEKNVDVDRVIVISDNEVNAGRRCTLTSLADRYRAHVGHDVWFHGWDVAGYGTTQLAGPKTSALCGFSERVLEFVAATESGMDGIAERIARLELPRRGAGLRAPLRYEDAS